MHRTLEDDPDNVATQEQDLSGLLGDVNRAIPGLNLTRENVLHALSAVGTRIDGESVAFPYIREHALPGLYSIVGGDLATARWAAEAAVDRICDKPSLSLVTPLPGGDVDDPAVLATEVHAAHPELPEELVERLVLLYGSETDTVLEQRRENDKKLRTNRPALVAQARHAVEREAARHLADVVFRRMALGYFGPVSPSALWELAIAMGRLLEWSLTNTEREIEAVLAATRRFSEPS